MKFGKLSLLSCIFTTQTDCHHHKGCILFLLSGKADCYRRTYIFYRLDVSFLWPFILFSRLDVFFLQRKKNDWSKVARKQPTTLFSVWNTKKNNGMFGFIFFLKYVNASEHAPKYCILSYNPGRRLRIWLTLQSYAVFIISEVKSTEFSRDFFHISELMNNMTKESWNKIGAGGYFHKPVSP